MSYIRIKSGTYRRNKVTVQVKHLPKYIKKTTKQGTNESTRV